jgi:uncharacterized protein
VSKPDLRSAREYVYRRLQTELPSDLTYHGIHHTRDDVLPAAVRLAKLSGLNGTQLLLLRAAALYHDLGYVEQYCCNEEVAVRLARETLPRFGFEPEQIETIAHLIMATQLPQAPASILEAIMCDADLDSLGRADYPEVSRNLYEELVTYGAHMTLTEWYERQLEFLTTHTYFTDAARELRAPGKAKNILYVKRRLEKLRER